MAQDVVAGYVTGGGNPDWKATHEAATRTARVVQALVDGGATMPILALSLCSHGTALSPIAVQRVSEVPYDIRSQEALEVAAPGQFWTVACYAR